MSGVVVVTVGFGIWVQISKAVFHIKGFDHLCKAGGHFRCWVMGTINLTCNAVQVTPYATRIQSVEQQLGDCLSTVLLPAGPAGGVIARGEVQVGHGQVTNIEDNCSSI